MSIAEYTKGLFLKPIPYIKPIVHYVTLHRSRLEFNFGAACCTKRSKELDDMLQALYLCAAPYQNCFYTYDFDSIEQVTVMHAWCDYSMGVWLCHVSIFTVYYRRGRYHDLELYCGYSYTWHSCSHISQCSRYMPLHMLHWVKLPGGIAIS